MLIFFRLKVTVNKREVYPLKTGFIVIAGLHMGVDSIVN